MTETIRGVQGSREVDKRKRGKKKTDVGEEEKIENGRDLLKDLYNFFNFLSIES